jgi:pyrroline-5-carboxylate reductase
VIVGLIGAGNMASALARGWASAEAGPDDLLLSDVDVPRARSLAAEVGGKQLPSGELAENADLVVLCVKPGALNAVAKDVRVTVSDRGLPLASVLGATSTARIEDAFGAGTPVLRFMPNVAAEVRMATFCYAPGSSVDPSLERNVLDLFGLLGEIVPVDERLMDAATAISGCGPAFLALVAEALIDAGVKEGLTAQQATELSIQTLAGTAELLRAHGGDTASVRRKVTSPGGVTAAGLAVLEERGLRAALAGAVEAVVAKARTAQVDTASHVGGAPAGGQQ